MLDTQGLQLLISEMHKSSRDNISIFSVVEIMSENFLIVSEHYPTVSEHYCHFYAPECSQTFNRFL